jgi:hypothetical protein
MTTALTINNQTLTLKSYKTVKWMSEETICFTTTVCLDGKPVCTACNEGHGGSTNIGWVSAIAERKAEDLALLAKPGDYGWDFATSLKFVDLVDILVHKVDADKEAEKALKKVVKDMTDKVVFVLPGEDPKQGYRYLKCGSANIRDGIQKMLVKYPGCTIYNDYPIVALKSVFLG